MSAASLKGMGAAPTEAASPEAILMRTRAA